jgi:hypothetical protein
MRAAARCAILIACAASLSAAAVGCGSDAPTARVVSASPLELDPSLDEADDLVLRVAYTDANGDLGRGMAEVYDCRAEGLVTRLSIPPIASDEAVAEGVPIDGELVLTVADVGEVAALPSPPSACRDFGAGAPSAGAQVFCVVLIDSAGNASDGDCTSPILVAPKAEP